MNTKSKHKIELIETQGQIWLKARLLATITRNFCFTVNQKDEEFTSKT